MASRGRGPAPGRGALAALFVTIVVATGCSSKDDAPTASATTTTVPLVSRTVAAGDLYAPPDPLPGQSHGDLIWSEPLSVPAGVAARAWRILYRSESLTGQPIAVSGFVVAPAAAATAPRPIVAWAHGSVGSADSCAPSKHLDFTGGTDPASLAVTAQLLAFVEQGSVVVASDYEGLGTPGPHPYLVGASEGRGVLDSSLAVRQLPGAGAGDQVVAYGVSQGGHAALWAGELAATWAPGVRLAGVVAAAPFSNIDLLLAAASSAPGGEGYFVLGVYGQAASNPALDPTAVLDPAIVTVAPAIEQRCLSEFQTIVRNVVTETGRPAAMTDARTLAPWRDQLASIEPGRRPIGAPVLVLQGNNDSIVPSIATRALVARMCGAHQNVVARYYANAGHTEVVRSADADLRAWIADRFAGRPATSACA